MVTRSRKEAVDVRGQVLAEALRLFAAHGFDGTALQDVADAVGVSKPAVLHHFPSKEQLRDAVLASLVEHWKEALPRLLLAATASEDRFDAVFGELHRFFNEAPDRARLVLRELLDRPEETRRLLRGAVRPYLEAIAAYIREGQRSGRHFAAADAEAYLIHVLQLVISAAASAGVLAPQLGANARSRYDGELARIAKSSLFDPSVPPLKRSARR